MKKKDGNFSKWIMKTALIQGYLMMWASYILAAFDKVQIAESLSRTVCVEIVGVALGYFGKAGVENISKHNTWPDKHHQDRDL